MRQNRTHPVGLPAERSVQFREGCRHLLVQDTALDTSQDETLSILDASGNSARPARLGTWARKDDCIAGGHGSVFETAGTASAIDVTSRRWSSLPPMSTEGADTDSATP